MIQRDSHGRFARHSQGGPGRPSYAIDLARLAAQKAEETGYDLRAALWDVLLVVVDQAKGGCVQSAKLVFDKLCPQAPDDDGDIDLALRLKAARERLASRRFPDGEKGSMN